VLNAPVLALVMAFALGGVILGFYTVGLSIVGERVAPKDIAAANAAFLIMYQVGAILGPLAAGAAMTLSPVLGFIATVCGLMLISAIALQVFARRK
ncbi:MAG: MFS transporter, partial [Hyphomicrobium sp.]